MPEGTDQELDIVSRLPQLGDVALEDLLRDRLGESSALASILERVRELAERPTDAVAAFSNFTSVDWQE